MRPWIQCAGLCLLIGIGPLACGASPASPNGVALNGDEIKGGAKADGGQDKGQADDGQGKGKANGKNKTKKPKKAHPDAGVVDDDEATDEAVDRDAATDEADEASDTDEGADEDSDSDESSDSDEGADET